MPQSPAPISKWRLVIDKGSQPRPLSSLASSIPAKASFETWRARPVRTASFDLHKPALFRRCLILPNGTTVIPRCSLPPGAESTFLNYLREEVCGLSSKTQRKHPPLRQFKRQHHRLSHSTHPRRRASAVPALASLPVWVPAWRSRDQSSLKRTCRSIGK